MREEFGVHLVKSGLLGFYCINSWVDFQVIYQTEKTVFDDLSKWREESWKYDAQRSIFDESIKTKISRKVNYYEFEKSALTTLDEVPLVLHFQTEFAFSSCPVLSYAWPRYPAKSPARRWAVQHSKNPYHRKRKPWNRPRKPSTTNLAACLVRKAALLF